MCLIFQVSRRSGYLWALCSPQKVEFSPGATFLASVTPEFCPFEIPFYSLFSRLLVFSPFAKLSLSLSFSFKPVRLDVFFLSFSPWFKLTGESDSDEVDCRNCPLHKETEEWAVLIKGAFFPPFFPTNIVSSDLLYILWNESTYYTTTDSVSSGSSIRILLSSPVSDYHLCLKKKKRKKSLNRGRG